MKGMAALIGALLAVGYIAASVTLTGVAVSTLWGWYITPAFSIAAPTTPQAIALAFVVQLVLPTAPMPRPEDRTTMMWARLLSPVIALLIGWGMRAWL